MMILAWHKRMDGSAYPVIWFTQLPTKGEGEPDTLNRIVQHHTLSVEEQNEMDSVPRAEWVTHLAQKYPYKPQIEVDAPIEHVKFEDAIDAAVDRFNERQRSTDGQHQHIKENWL